MRAALAEVPDPELPVTSIVDLGMVHGVSVTDDVIRVELLPTFVGCPALDAIESAVRDRLGAFGRPVELAFTFVVSWTSDRISQEGLAKLRSVGVAAPISPGVEPVCPWCGSNDVVLDNLFGPTQCRSLHYCRGCRQPFEAVKRT